MIGLRERQKETRRKDMLKAAKTLFVTRGYEAVKMDEIAQSANVSSGTLYTYFKTKRDLLLSVIVEDFDFGLAHGIDVIEGPVSDALSAINQLTKCHYTTRKGGPTSEMWRFAVTAFISHPKSQFARKYEACLVTVRSQFVVLINRLKSMGHLPESIDTQDLAYLLDGSATLSFLEFIREDCTSDKVLLDRQQRMNTRLLYWAGFDQ